MTSLLASLPLQLVCQFIIPGTPIIDRTKYEVNKSPSSVHRGTLPEGYIAPGFRSVLLADLSLELVCEMLLSRNTAENVTPETIPPLTLPQGYVFFAEDRAAYKIHEIPLSWDRAREVCASTGGHLAIIDSLEKIKRVKSMNGYSNDVWMHVGIYHSKSKQEWVRIDNGLPINSLPWKEGQPEGSGTCSGISPIEDGLVDYPCALADGHFVCEIKF